MVGYSGTPLVKKLGIKPGDRMILCNEPESFISELGGLPPGVKATDRLTSAVNFALFFTDRRADLKKAFPALVKKLESNGMLWISWPKKSSGKPTDLTEDVVREIGLAAGVVDVKVCAIDETWSGLKFVFRLQDRAAAPKDTPKGISKSGPRKRFVVAKGKAAAR